MYAAMIGSLIRAGLIAFGATEMISDDEISQIVGAVLALGSVGWSLWQKYRAHDDLKKAQGGW